MEIKYGEVVKNSFNDTYTDKYPDDLFTIYVQEYDTDGLNPIPCMPISNQIKSIPLIGEHVIIFKMIDEFTSADSLKPQWYYLPPYPIKSNINNNYLGSIAVPRTGNVSQGTEQPAMGNTFVEKGINPLQPYEGDTLIEGRWGNSIRLGSSISNDVDGEDFYTLNTTWKSAHENRGDPIIILSNKRNNKPGRQFVVEDTKNDGASLYLTSTQYFPDLVLNKQLSKSDSESSFNSSQFIGIADRIILKANTNIIALDSKKRVTINTPHFLLGDETAGAPMVHGNVLLSILQDIISAISSGVIGPIALTSYPIDQGSITSALGKLEKLNSGKYYIKE